MREALVSVIGEKPAPLVNAITAALAVRDPDAPVITTKGKPKADPHSGTTKRSPPIQTSHPRDRHQQTARHPRIPNRPSTTTSKKKSPLRPRRLARPHQNQNRYAIPLTRHFYTYTPPRPSKRSTPRSRPSKPKSKPSRRGDRVMVRLKHLASLRVGGCFYGERPYVALNTSRVGPVLSLRAPNSRFALLHALVWLRLNLAMFYLGSSDLILRRHGWWIDLRSHQPS